MRRVIAAGSLDHRIVLKFNRHCQNNSLTHLGRVTYLWVGKLTIIGPDNGLLSGRRQVIDWNNAGILLIGPLGTLFSEFLIEIKENAFRNLVWKNGDYFVSASTCFNFRAISKF